MTTDYGHEFFYLTKTHQQNVTTVVNTARIKGEATQQFEGGNAYAYKHGNGGIAWGVNGGEHGFCIARGIARVAY